MVSSINQTSAFNTKYTEQNTGEKQFAKAIQDSRPDSFVKTDKSNNGKFDISEAGKNFLKGVISPITAVIKHPVATLGIIGATAAACALVPVLGPLTAIGFGALSLFQLGKGCYNAAKLYKNGQYDNAEKAFNEIGQGTVGVALTAVGVKQSAKVAKEAKLMNELNVTSLSKAQKQAIASEVNEGTFASAMKEVGSLFTTKSGLKAVLYQFKPANISQRGKDALNFIFKREEVTKVKEKKMDFKDTAEGKRRAQLSSEEIEKEINSLYKEAFDEYGVPEEIRPEIKITQQDLKHGGGYNSSLHKIEINETAYREGCFDLPDVIKHESTHANEAILRQRLSVGDKEKLAQEFFLNKIQNGEKDKIIVDANFLGVETKNAPKLNQQMKTDFSQLAKEKLYVNGKLYSQKELTAMVEPLVENNPEFVSMCGGKEQAIQTMSEYAKSHNLRYYIAMKNSSGFNTSGIDTTLLKPLSEEEKALAMKSFTDGIDCLESNAAGRGNILGIGGNFDQYQFCAEEVLAQQKGNNFEIAKLNKQLEALRSQQNYNKGEEARILSQIKKSELTIEYKTKGAKFYELYTKSMNNPQDKKLAKQVIKLKNELNILQSKINKISHLQANDFMGFDARVVTREYIPYQAKVPVEGGASVYIPYNTPYMPAMIHKNEA